MKASKKLEREFTEIGDISAQIQHYVENHGFSVLRGYCGHGIGSEMHEDPGESELCNIEKEVSESKPGMCLAIEPMVCQFDYKYYIGDDDWAVIMRDGGLTAHYENTVLVTNGEPVILTKPW